MTISIAKVSICFDYLVTDAVPTMISITTTSGVLRRAVAITLNTVGSSGTSSFTASLGKTRANGCLGSLSKEKSSDECGNGDFHDSCVGAGYLAARMMPRRIYTFDADINVASVNAKSRKYLLCHILDWWKIYRLRALAHH